MPTATLQGKSGKANEIKGSVYCPLCTHTVPGNIVFSGKGLKVVSGQRCPRCSSSLDAGYVMWADKAA